MTTPIEHISEYKIAQSDFRSLSKLDQAAIGVSSFAVSETNTFARLYVSSSLPMIGNSTIDAINSLQRHTLLRVWSAKLFEYLNFLKDLNNACRRSDHSLSNLVGEMMRRSRELRSGRGYEFAKEVRNAASNHYLLDRALSNLDHLSERSDLRIFVHGLQGNSSSAIGEEVMFVGILNRMRNDGEDHDFYDDWHRWNLQASTWLKDCHVNFWNEIIFQRFPDTYAKKKPHWLPEEFVGEIDTDFAPLFLRRRKE